MKNLKYKFEYLLFLFFKPLIQLFGENRFFLTFFSYIIYHILRRYRKIVRKNLEVVFGKRFARDNYQKITKECIENLLLNLVTVIKNINRTNEDISKLVEFKNRKVVDNILKNGKSVIFTSGHIGNWEMLVVGVASQIVPGVGVAEKLKNPYLNKILFESRERFRIGVIPMKGALRKLVYSIRKGVPVFIIMDQAVNPGRGTEKDFFGFPAIHTETPQYLSKKYDLFIVPTFIKQQDNGKYLIEFEKPFKADEVQDCLHHEIDILEKRIIENTEQWLWCHKRWKNHKDFYK